jgi:hypothetical protein
MVLRAIRRSCEISSGCTALGRVVLTKSVERRTASPETVRRPGLNWHTFGGQLSDCEYAAATKAQTKPAAARQSFLLVGG